MVKKVLFLAMTGVIAMSCQMDKETAVTKDNAISFRSVLNKATRATEVTTATLPSFKVFGFKSSDLNLTTASPAFMTETVTGSGDASSRTWTPDVTHFWPDYELTFFAYSPEETQATITNTEQKISDYTPAQKVEEQKDLVVAVNKGTKAANQTAGVPLSFSHALSQIKIQAKCSNPSLEIEVIGTKIVNLGAKGTFTYRKNPTTAGTLLFASTWGNVADKGMPEKAYVSNKKESEEKVTITGVSPSELESQAAKSLLFESGSYMVVPQKTPAYVKGSQATGAYIAFLIRAYTKDAAGVKTLVYPRPTSTDNKDGKYAYAIVPLTGPTTTSSGSANPNEGFQFNPGKRYVFTLYFGGKDGRGGIGQVDPNPTDPTNPTNPNIDTNPKGGGDPDGGTPILDHPISFTVSVDDWVDESDPSNVAAEDLSL